MSYHQPVGAAGSGPTAPAPWQRKMLEQRQAGGCTVALGDRLAQAHAATRAAGCLALPLSMASSPPAAKAPPSSSLCCHFPLLLLCCCLFVAKHWKFDHTGRAQDKSIREDGTGGLFLREMQTSEGITTGFAPSRQRPGGRTKDIMPRCGQRASN